MRNPIPYKYICIEGNIGAGKTTLSTMLAQDYNCTLILEQFAENPFLETFYTDPERFALPVELFFLAERQKQLQASLINQELFSSFTLADYTLIKSLLFARNNLNTDEYKLFQKIYQSLSHSIPKPDLIVYLHRSVPKIQDNILHRGRSYESMIENQYLEEIQNAYFDFFKTQTIIPVIVIDAENLDFVHNSKHYEEIKKILHQDYQPGLHHMRILF